jgi:hypothetical protein
MSIIYGRFTESELDRRQGDPHVQVGARRYRITELVHRMDGGANYQAVEVDARAREAEPEPEPVAVAHASVTESARRTGDDTGWAPPEPTPNLQDALMARRSEEDVADHEALAAAVGPMLDAAVNVTVIGCEGPPCTCGHEAALAAGRCFAGDASPEPTNTTASGVGTNLRWPVPEAPPDFKPIAPALKPWAKEHGWKGRGPISLFIRNQYIAEFGEEAYRLNGA